MPKLLEALNVVAGLQKPHVIQQIERFEADLQGLVFPDAEFSRQRGVELEKSRAENVRPPMFPNVPVAGWANAAGFSQDTHGALFAHGPPWRGMRIGEDLIHASVALNPSSAGPVPDNAVSGDPDEKR